MLRPVTEYATTERRVSADVAIPFRTPEEADAWIKGHSSPNSISPYAVRLGPLRGESMMSYDLPGHHGAQTEFPITLELRLVGIWRPDESPADGDILQDLMEATYNTLTDLGERASWQLGVEVQRTGVTRYEDR